MAPDGTPPTDRSAPGTPRGDGGRNRRRGGRGGRGGAREGGRESGREGAREGGRGPAGAPPQGQGNAANAGNSPGEARSSRPNPPQQRQGQPPLGGPNSQGRNREADNRNRQQQGGRRGPDAGNRGGTRGNQQDARPQQSQQSQRSAERTRRRDVEDEAPNLLEWAIDHAGYTFWIAHAEILPATISERAVRSYVVDVHAGDDAVNTRLWPAIAPFLELEVAARDKREGRKLLADLIASKAVELELPAMAAYLEVAPPVEQAVSSPVQAALDTAIPLELDTLWEDIEVMNEGRRGAPLKTRMNE